MVRKGYTAEQNISRLRKAEVIGSSRNNRRQFFPSSDEDQLTEDINALETERYIVTFKHIKSEMEV